ncbi:hypothetical protein QYF61_006998 [Mycteria americana]|uniref:Uncharacterized protein n=1 Tax=Mycteria americana TaxID=33587 RepID=A0AAN7MKS0_MYCAM|nr:hypothetical protein QYF61_006998 [Mycteria americana]
MLLTGPQAGSDALQSKWAVGPWSDSTLAVLMRGFTVGGTTEYRTATTRSRDGEEREGGFRGDPQHGPEDLHIGQYNENKTPKSKDKTDDKKPNFPEKIGHGFGDSGGDASKVKNREVEEEEVHGGVEAVVTGYGGDHEAVAQEGSQVDAQEEPEVQELQLPRVCKCQEEELDTPVLPGQSSSKLEILSIYIMRPE